MKARISDRNGRSAFGCDWSSVIERCADGYRSRHLPEFIVENKRLTVVMLELIADAIIDDL